MGPGAIRSLRGARDWPVEKEVAGRGLTFRERRGDEEYRGRPGPQQHYEPGQDIPRGVKVRTLERAA